MAKLIDDARLKLLTWARYSQSRKDARLEAILAPLAKAVEGWELLESLAGHYDDVSIIGGHAVLWEVTVRDEEEDREEVFLEDSLLAALKAAVEAMNEEKRDG